LSDVEVTVGSEVR